MLIHLNSLIIYGFVRAAGRHFLNQSSGLYCRGSVELSRVDIQSAPSYLLLLQLLQLRSLSAHSGPTLIRAKINQSIILLDFYIFHCLSTPLYINKNNYIVRNCTAEDVWVKDKEFLVILPLLALNQTSMIWSI